MYRKTIYHITNNNNYNNLRQRAHIAFIEHKIYYRPLCEAAMPFRYLLIVKKGMPQDT